MYSSGKSIISYSLTLLLFISVGIFLLSFSDSISKASNEETKKSLAFKRYKESNLKFEKVNPFFTQFKKFEVTGLGYMADPLKDEAIQNKLEALVNPYPGPFRLAKKFPELQVAYLLRNNIEGFSSNTTFRDPTSPIKIGDTYHIWYTKTWGDGPAGQEAGSQKAYQESKNNWRRIYSWDMASIWHATSKDGYHWQEQGVALEPGPKGSFDDRCVFTPDVLVANGKYYLYYQVAKSPHVYKEGPHQIAMAWANSPEGPWHKHDKLILEPSKSGFDSKKVHDPCLIKKGDKYWLYYKGDGDHEDRTQLGEHFDIGWGVAIADQPEGPFVRSELNPIVAGGHEVFMFPYKSGVCALVRQGPELYTIQYAPDALNFEVVSHLTDIPHAGVFFRQGHFKDIDKHPAKFPKWGLAHDYVLGNPEAHIIRFNVNFREHLIN